MTERNTPDKLLSQRDRRAVLNSLHTTQLDDSGRKRAHMAARTMLNQYADGPEEVAVDMTAAPWWRDCIASHKVVEDMSAVGITGFSAQAILGIKDSNRQNHTRIDVVVSLADGF